MVEGGEFHFFAEVLDDFGVGFPVEVAAETVEGYPNYVAVVEFAAELLADIHPDFVELLHVFGPEAGRVGPEVDVGTGAARAEGFEREGVARLGEFLPGLADAVGQFARVHVGGDAGDEARGL